MPLEVPDFVPKEERLLVAVAEELLEGLVETVCDAVELTLLEFVLDAVVVLELVIVREEVVEAVDVLLLVEVRVELEEPVELLEAVDDLEDVALAVDVAD